MTSYNYEAALRQLNIQPETLSVTESEESMRMSHRSSHQQIDFHAAREADQKLQQLTSKRVKTLEQIIQDKITQIASLENDLLLAQNDTKQV